MRGEATIGYAAVDGAGMLVVPQMCEWRLWWFRCCCRCDVASWGVDVGSGGADDMVAVVGRRTAPVWPKRQGARRRQG
jgi:hypothetical protein